MSGRRGAGLRVVHSGPCDPALNLAVDAALLTAATPVATLRLYGWSPHGLSLGRFQDPSAFRAVTGGHVLVRRQTGGGAIYHADEITFAIAIDAEDYWPTEIAYARVHDAIVRALGRVGVAASRQSAAGPPQSARALRGAWCFESPGRHDVIGPDGHKLCGSAQRRIRRPRDRVLHHGSLVLRAPAATPFCGSVEDQVDAAQAGRDLPAALVAELAAELGLEPRPGELSSGEVDAARGLADRFLIGAPAGDESARREPRPADRDAEARG